MQKDETMCDILLAHVVICYHGILQQNSHLESWHHIQNLPSL